MQNENKNTINLKPIGFSAIKVEVNDQFAGQYYAVTKGGEDVWRVAGVDLWFSTSADAKNYVLKQAKKKGMFQ